MPEAVELVERAERGELALHLPAFCLLEAGQVLSAERFTPKAAVNPIREFVRMGNGTEPGDRDAAYRALAAYETYMRAAVRAVPDRVESLRRTSGVEVFPASDPILARSIALMSVARLKPFDLTILASVLVRAEELVRGGEPGPFKFCEQDGDLQPWDSKAAPKAWLQELYDAAQIQVFADFRIVDAA